MNVGVIGSRGFNDRKLMFEILDAFEPFVLVSGGAIGADSLAEEYADRHNYPKIIHIPDWNKYGSSAGFRRNRLIVDDSDLVIAFWDYRSIGTRSTICLCDECGVPVEVIDYPSLRV